MKSKQEPQASTKLERSGQSDELGWIPFELLSIVDSRQTRELRCGFRCTDPRVGEVRAAVVAKASAEFAKMVEAETANSAKLSVYRRLKDPPQLMRDHLPLRGYARPRGTGRVRARLVHLPRSYLIL